MSTIKDDPEVLTTGSAAKLLAVTPDTIRRWVKRGRLQATRTRGGHQRILLRDIEPLMPGLPASDSSARSAVCTSAAMYCWEYLSSPAKVRDECRRCIVYRSRTTWCFRLAELSDGVRPSKLFCHTTCTDCAYYRRVKHLATKVLVITKDQDLVSRLEDDPHDTLSVFFAGDVYEASSAIGEHRPGIVLLDWDLDQARSGELLERLASDTRVPGLKIIVVVRNSYRRSQAAEQISDEVVGILEKPLDARCIGAILDRFPVEVLPAEEVGNELPNRDGGLGARVAINTANSGVEPR